MYWGRSGSHIFILSEVTGVVSAIRPNERYCRDAPHSVFEDQGESLGKRRSTSRVSRRTAQSPSFGFVANIRYALGVRRGGGRYLVSRLDMAQWLGQFSGLTHATRVQDAEACLRHAIEVFPSAVSIADRKTKAKAVRRLAERVLAARIKLIKSRIADAFDAGERHYRAESAARRATEVALLKKKEDLIREGGVDAILNEFHAADSPIS